MLKLRQWVTQFRLHVKSVSIKNSSDNQALHLELLFSPTQLKVSHALEVKVFFLILRKQSDNVLPSTSSAEPLSAYYYYYW